MIKNTKVWKLSVVLWCVVLVASIEGIYLWFKKYLTTGEADWLPIILFVCSSFSAVMWMILYRREKKKGAEK